MITVHKYPLPITDGWQPVKIPADARLLHVAEQPPGSAEILNGAVQVWAEVNTDRTPETRYLAVVGTGQEVPRSPRGRRPIHVGTVVTASGALVWHVYAEPAVL